MPDPATTRRDRARGHGAARLLLAVMLPVVAVATVRAQQAALTPPKTVPGELALPDHELPNAYAGYPFSTGVSFQGGVAPFRVLIAGQVPHGLDVVAGPQTVMVVGVPTEWGSFNLDLVVTDSTGRSVQRNYQLTVHPAGSTGPAVVTDAEAIKVADAYNVFFPAKIADAEAVKVNDVDSVFFPAVVNDAEAVKVGDADSVFFPAKVADNEAVKVGDSYFDVGSAQVTDAEGIKAGDAYSVVANVGVTPTTIPAGTYNTTYSTVTFTAAGATGVATLTASGTAPTGMTLSKTPPAGMTSGYVTLSGTPTQTGTFPFTITVTNTGNSQTNTVAYTLVINKQTQTITPGTAPTPTYGGAAFSVTATASSGLPVTIATTSPLVSGSGPYSPIGAGMATFTASQGGNANFAAATPVNINVSIAKAPLPVTATSYSRVFDQPNPGTLGYSFGSFVNGDTSAVVSGVPVVSLAATPISAITGTAYPITPSTGTLGAANYAFSFVNGGLTITQAPQTITFYPLPNLANGTTFPLSARASSGLAVTYGVSGPASIANGVLSVTGTGVVTVTASQAGNANYSAATAVARSFTAQ